MPPSRLPRLRPQVLLQLHPTQHSPVMKTPESLHSEEKEPDRDRDLERSDRVGAKQKSSAPSSSKCSSALLKPLYNKFVLTVVGFMQRRISHMSLVNSLKWEDVPPDHPAPSPTILSNQGKRRHARGSSRGRANLATSVR